MKKTSPELEDTIVQLYLDGIKLKEIENLTGCKCIKHVLKRKNIKRKRNPKEYCSNTKDQRNKELIEDYLNLNLSISQICKKYNITDVNLYRILKNYNIETCKNRNNHWVIHKKRKDEPYTECKFYILENYYGYTKIGITTKSQVKERYNKNVNVVYELKSTLETCYNIEFNLKKKLNSYKPKSINKTIDGWSECYDLEPKQIILLIDN